MQGHADRANWGAERQDLPRRLIRCSACCISSDSQQSRPGSSRRGSNPSGSTPALDCHEVARNSAGGPATALYPKAPPTSRATTLVLTSSCRLLLLARRLQLFVTTTPYAPTATRRRHASARATTSPSTRAALQLLTEVCLSPSLEPPPASELPLRSQRVTNAQPTSRSMNARTQQR
jgi:hypothetical protein